MKPCIFILVFLSLKVSSAMPVYYLCDTNAASVNLKPNETVSLLYNGSFDGNGTCVWNLNIPDDCYMTIYYDYEPTRPSDLYHIRLVGQNGQVFYTDDGQDTADRVPSYRGFTAVTATLDIQDVADTNTTNTTHISFVNITLNAFHVVVSNEIVAGRTVRLVFPEVLFPYRTGVNYTFPSDVKYIQVLPIVHYWTPASKWDYIYFRGVGTNATRFPNMTDTFLAPQLDPGALVIPGNSLTVTIDVLLSEWYDSWDDIYLVGLHDLSEMNATTIFYSSTDGWRFYNQTATLVNWIEDNGCILLLTVNSGTVDVYLGDPRDRPFDNSTYIFTLDSQTQYIDSFFIGETFSFDARKGDFNIEVVSATLNGENLGAYRNYTGFVVSQGWPYNLPWGVNGTTANFGLIAQPTNLSVHYDYHLSLKSNASTFRVSTPKHSLKTSTGPGDFTKKSNSKSSELKVDFNSASSTEHFVFLFSVGATTTASWLTLLLILNGSMTLTDLGL